MRTSCTLIGGLLLGALLAGCASTKIATQKPSTLETLRSELRQLSARTGNLEVNMNGLESLQQETRNELRTLTGLQQGLQQQLNAIAQQLQAKEAAPAASEPDEK